MATAETFSPEQFEAAYPEGVQSHWWNVCRNRFVLAKLQRLRPADRMLEIGCGRGIVVDYLRGHGVDCWGCDPGSPSPISDRVDPFLFLAQDAFGLDARFRAGVQTLLLLDLLEHLDEPNAFLTKCWRAFPHATYVMITLPARREVWSEYDVAYGHRMRYDLATLQRMLEKLPRRSVSMGYWFHLPYLVAFAYALTNSPRRVAVRVPRGRLGRTVHWLLARAMLFESRVMPSRLLGTSLWAVVTRGGTGAAPINRP